LGPQVTPVGSVNVTMLSISPGQHDDLCELPPVEQIKWHSHQS
jgi:hypothetical protein